MAYRHPIPFRKLSGGLMALTFVALGIASVWNLSSDVTAIAVTHPLGPPHAAVVHDAALSVTPPIWFTLALVAFFGYLVFLRALPKLLGEEQPIRKQRSAK